MMHGIYGNTRNSYFYFNMCFDILEFSVFNRLFGLVSPAFKSNIKVSGPFVETSCVFQCIKIS